MADAETTPAEEMFDAALSAKMRGELDKAVEGFTAVLRQYPHHVQAFLQLGKCEILRGNVPAAMNVFRAGVKVSQTSAPLLAELGFLLLVTDDDQRAHKVLLAARKMSKRNVRALTGLAWIHVRRQTWGKAIAALEELSAVAGSSFAAHYLMAQVHEALGKIADAQREWFLTEDICREMIKVTDGQVAAHYFLGDILRVTRDWSAAREDFEAAAEQAPAGGEGYVFGLGLAVRWATVLETAATACAEAGDAERAAAWRARLPAGHDAVPESSA